ncbi:SWIM-type domain-containing protein [Mycena indigotica]|uniref:SWIM-type domain-containing protein n=1 Tax=Mycena indigotica TaxID=2126181 RepID=A0A8H6SW53_9AGAR|nr:SWIM-type domain-containing protein [Mycena indigotica]KAF7306383.1 SWIM-type domain-containing protein [Mycena indigotica]
MTSAIISTGTDNEDTTTADDVGLDSASQVSDAEIRDMTSYDTRWASPPPYQTLGERQEEEREVLPRLVALLEEHERNVAACYDVDEVIGAITRFYRLLIDMGQWEPEDLVYPPHTNPPINVQRAFQLGYDERVVQLMQKLPYLKWTVGHDEKKCILFRTSFVNYTKNEDLEKGRQPYPGYELDPWLLPLLVPGRYGWLVMLDTELGVVRAFEPHGFYRPDLIEFKRHGLPPEDPDQDPHPWRRVPTVPASQYFNTLIEVYRSLERLPIIDPGMNDPAETLYKLSHEHLPSSQKEWNTQSALLDLYRECGWPDSWRRAEFLSKWRAKKAEIDY